MVSCFSSNLTEQPIPITILTQSQFRPWLKDQSKNVSVWLDATQFSAEPGSFSLIPNSSGNIESVLIIIREEKDFWPLGVLPFSLPQGTYQLNNFSNPLFQIAWGLGAYHFSRYKKPLRDPAKLYIHEDSISELLNIIESIYLVRDWINTPADEMGPSEFSKVIFDMVKKYDASLTEIKGESLLTQNYASIYTVGRASDDAPRLLDLRWGDPAHPKVTIVGKGVCFDSGGLDLKTAPYMLLMKKDMAGGAHAFGLARMIMEAKLPISLRILVPVVENVINGNAYRPGDVIKSRKGITIEIGNTDAEGRVILADALTEAASENPTLLIDFCTLTGAARVALGTDLPALFSNNDKLAEEVIKYGDELRDPMWRLPLFSAYRESLNSTIADINNCSLESFAGAITAALFLKEFVPDTIPWLHIDMMAWNLKPRPGRPQGGEAMTLRALFSYLASRFANA